MRWMFLLLLKKSSPFHKKCTMNLSLVLKLECLLELEKQSMSWLQETQEKFV